MTNTPTSMPTDPPTRIIITPNDTGKIKNPFYDQWMECLRAHYHHVIVNNDVVTEPSLHGVLIETGFEEEEISAIRDQALWEMAVAEAAALEFATEATFDLPIDGTLDALPEAVIESAVEALSEEQTPEPMTVAAEFAEAQIEAAADAVDNSEIVLEAIALPDPPQALDLVIDPVIEPLFTLDPEPTANADTALFKPFRGSDRAPKKPAEKPAKPGEQLSLF